MTFSPKREMSPRMIRRSRRRGTPVDNGFGRCIIGNRTITFPLAFTDEQNGLKYELVGDYSIVAGEDEPPTRPIGVWGARRRDYLKQHRQRLYYELLFSGKLSDHLADVEEQA